MAIKISFNGKTLSHPGAYSKLVVADLTGFPLSPTGVVGIIGEAVGGAPGVLDVLNGQAIQSAKDRYKSGPIADALGLLAAPSKDGRIANGASTVIVYKTNDGTQATYDLQDATPTTLAALTTENYGADENQVSALVAAGTIADADAAIAGTVDGPFTLAGGETLIVSANSVVYTFTNTLTGSTTAAAMAAELDDAGKWAPAKPVIATANLLKVDLVLDPLVVTGGAADKGYLDIDPTSTIDTLIGLAGSDRGTAGSRFLTLAKDDLEEVMPEIGTETLLSIKYVGAGVSTAALTISDVGGDRKLTTAIGGLPADDLDITLAELVDGELKSKFTLSSLAALIDGNAAYEASVIAKGDSNATILDYYTAVEINDVALEMKGDMDQMVGDINLLSSLASAVRTSNVSGLLATFADPALFAGATDGVSSNTSFGDGFAALKGIRANNIVPLISKDTGAVSIASVHAFGVTHAIEMWATDGKSERQVWLSQSGSKTDIKDAAKAASFYAVAMLGQEAQVLGADGELTFKDPWATACLAAGMRSGSEVGEPLTFKFANLVDLRAPALDFDPLVDFEEFIDAGVMLLEPVDTGGFRFIVDNTTYGKDANFVYNRGSVVEAAGFVAYDLRKTLEDVFTGTKAKTGEAENIASFIRDKMDQYLEADILVGDDDNEGLGFKNLSVSLTGNRATIDISVTPVQGIDFILPTIYLQDIKQSAA
jgi:hypothetical protein